MSLAFVTLLLVCQLFGEMLARLFGLPLPGPVIGMMLLFVGLVIRGGVPERLQRTASGLLQHLSLLFVPAGVGVVAHVGLIAEAWLPLTAAIVVSTLATIAVTALVMAHLARRLGDPPHGEAVKHD